MRGTLTATVVALFSLAASPALAAARTDCQPQAIRDLQRLAPQGHAVFLAMRDKKQFLAFLTCDDVQLGLSTAVHESVHILTEQLDAYPLIGGGSVPRQHVVSRFYPPREIAGKFKGDDSYVQTYLRRGAASSADDLMFLLDEMNAYSHDLASATKLVDLNKREGQVDHRAGLAALMAFFMQYVEVARERKPSTWEGLRRDEVKGLVTALWQQAETTLVASLPIRGFGGEVYVPRLCEPRNGQALAELLGRSPFASPACGTLTTAASPAGGGIAK
jgi:hypothetical protein